MVIRKFIAIYKYVDSTSLQTHDLSLQVYGSEKWLIKRLIKIIKNITVENIIFWK